MGAAVTDGLSPLLPETCRRVSVVIPALNEEKALPSTLQALVAQDGWTDAWVVDGGSTDATPDVVREFALQDSRIHGITAPRGRGSQMNAGARRARGDQLLFLHADTVPDVGCLDALHTRLTDQRIRAGCFTHRFSNADLPLRLLSALHNLRFDWTRIAYGDQAMFVDCRLFWKIGGFPETAIEDIRFGKKLRRVARPCRLDAVVTTDSRKFRRLGTWRAMCYVLYILANYKAGRIPRSRFFENVR